jgi:hypothetical protein
MNRVTGIKGIYRDNVSGKFWYRPFSRGRRTWRRLYARTLEEAKVEYGQITEVRRSQKIREQLLAVANEPVADLTGLPSCLYKYAHMVKVFYPPKRERGLYFLMDGKECVYVGQSDRSVQIRIAQHQVDKTFTKVFYIPFEGDLDAPERHFIALLKPKYNSKDIEGIVAEPFETPAQRKHRRARSKERVIQACLKCGDTYEEATRKANILLKSKDFDPDLLCDELPSGKTVGGKPWTAPKRNGVS